MIDFIVECELELYFTNGIQFSTVIVKGSKKHIWEERKKADG